MASVNPYWGAHFFEFFSTLFTRLWHWISGHDLSLAADEVQILVLSLVSISSGFLSPFLVLKKMAMFANSLSHTILLGVIGAFLVASTLWGGSLQDLSTLLLGAFLAALLTAFFTEGLIRTFRLQEDAGIGLVFTTLFALGILFVTLYTRNIHLSVEAIMGNADALQKKDVRLAAFFVLLNASILFLFYRRFQISIFDGSLAKTLGIRQGFYQFLLLFLAAATIIGAFRSVGAFLVLAYLVGPYLTARLFCHRLLPLLFWTPGLGILASILSIALSRHFLSVYGLPLSTGGLAVSIIGIFYGVALLIRHFSQRHKNNLFTGAP